MSATELFDSPTTAHHPLADQQRPQSLDHFKGQTHLLGENGPLRQLIDADALQSCILWGPPGCGKTSLSFVISQITSARYLTLNAVTATIADIKDAVSVAQSFQLQGQSTILFIDEIHRFNKTQQDALLPSVERGTIILIGATTEHPFYSINRPLLSRCQVFELQPLSVENLRDIAESTIQNMAVHRDLNFHPEAMDHLIHRANGDARRLLNYLDVLQKTAPLHQSVTIDLIDTTFQATSPGTSQHDHYDHISALIKSMRGSDPDAAIYWLTLMLENGEDPVFIARRLVIFASEDVGNADPQAIGLATSVMQACQLIGPPEAHINLAQGVTYLATCPKSNASYMALKHAKTLIKNGTIHPVPDHLKSSPISSANPPYIYPHDHPKEALKQHYLPTQHSFYTPTQKGYEATISKRLDAFQKMKQDSQS